MLVHRSGFLLVAAVLWAAPGLGAQEEENTSGGPLLPEQAAYDVQFYDLALKVDPEAKAIDGTLTLKAKVLQPMEWLVLDLDPPLKVTAARDGTTRLEVERRGGRIWIKLGRAREPGEEIEVAVAYGGQPRVARNPPWTGGFTWAKTKDGRPWIATSCQGEGADLWWPCKDHPSDEPDGFALHITVPAPLVVASNGRLEKVEKKDGGWRTWHWRGSTPINNYGVALNIAPYEVIETKLTSTAGDTIPVFFYALPESAKKARKLLPEILDQLHWYEELFGPYPFRGDKYGVAETPHLGMEHQTIIAYGYRFQKDRWGYDWLHHHELSHEWWGNLVTAPDWNDMWIHEGIGTYCQALYVEKLRGEDAMRQEMATYRRSIANRRPIARREPQTSRQVYFGEGSGGHDNDIYFKGAWIVHTLRWLIGKDALLHTLRRMAYPDPAMEKKTDGSACHFGTTEDLRRTAEKETGTDLGWFFEVYLRQAAVPRLVHEVDGDTLRLRWEAPADLPFPMPVEIDLGGRRVRTEMPDGRAAVPLKGATSPEIDPDQWILRASEDGPRRRR